MSTLSVTNLKNAASATNNLVLAADGSVSILGGAVSPYTGMRNRIINGAMTIDQRNAGASVTITSDAYTLDRWLLTATQASKYSVQQNAGAVTPPIGFANYLGVTSLSAYSIVSSDAFGIAQRIEGFNAADFAWGTASAQAVTISFWVRSSLTGTFGGSIRNGAFNRSYPFTYSIGAANTWEYKTITIPGDTSGTWATNNTTGPQILFGLGVGATFSGTAGAWAGANYNSATGAVSVVGTNGATFYITGVQLEKGSVATPFEFRSIGTELGLAQRYWQKLGGDSYVPIGAGRQLSSERSMFYVKGNDTMRANPTVSFSGLTVTERASFDATVTALLTVNTGPNSLHVDVSHTSAGVSGLMVFLSVSASGTGNLFLNSEL
jgi:hypothetical protein